MTVSGVCECKGEYEVEYGCVSEGEYEGNCD